MSNQGGVRLDSLQNLEILCKPTHPHSPQEKMSHDLRSPPPKVESNAFSWTGTTSRIHPWIIVKTETFHERKHKATSLCC